MSDVFAARERALRGDDLPMSREGQDALCCGCEFDNEAFEGIQSERDALATKLAIVVHANDALAARVEQLTGALQAASDDARILVQDYYSGLPEHHAPVDGAVARLAHLLERDDQDCAPRTIDEIVTDGIAARAALSEGATDRG
jgi:hypothetical protein